MEEIKGKIIAGIYVLITILAIAITWTRIQILASNINDVTTQIIFWTGLIAFLGAHLIYIPIQLITGNGTLQPGKSAKSIIAFAVGLFCLIIGSWMLPTLIDSFDGLASTEMLETKPLIWLFVVLTYITVQIIVPTYYAVTATKTPVQ